MELTYELLRAGHDQSDSDTGAEIARKFNDNFERVKTLLGTLQHTVEFNQTTKSKIWTIQHNLTKRFVNVICFDTEGNQIFGDVTYSTINQCIVNFDVEIAGLAYVN